MAKPNKNSTIRDEHSETHSAQKVLGYGLLDPTDPENTSAIAIQVDTDGTAQIN